MKKLFSVLLASVLAVGLVACESGPTIGGTVTLGDTTKMDGSFQVGWGNNAADARVRDLVFGYSVASADQKGEIILDNTVVDKLTSVVEADGSKTFTVKLNSGLKYNDGTAITAKDYVFNAMLEASDEFLGIKGQSALAAQFVGHKDYQSGTSEFFKGVKIVDELTYTVTLAAENVPNFFELSYISLQPLPMHVIAPEADLETTAEGTRFTGVFDVATLEKTVANVNDGYRFFPKVTPGPYSLENYDTANAVATLKVNKEYKGNFEGQKPSVETLIFKSFQQEVLISSVGTGELDVTTATAGTEIIAGIALAEADKAQVSKYLRNGYGMVVLHANKGATESLELRQAINYALDKQEFARTFTDGYGQVVYSDYAAAQWQTKAVGEKLEEKLNTYPLDLEKAKAVLVQGGWNLDANGGPYTSGTRYRKLADGSLQEAKVNWLSTQDNSVTTLLNTMLPSNLAEIGININKTEVDFPTLSKQMQDKNSKYDMFNLAKSFASIYDTKYSMSSDEKYFGTYNWNMIADEQLNSLSQSLIKRDASDRDGYLDNWLAIQVRFNELSVNIPLYSNEYFDFVSPKLSKWETGSFWKWQQEILYVTVK